jgi:hypothetical protein
MKIFKIWTLFIMCCGLTAIVALSFSCERETECTHPTRRYQITDGDISPVPYTSNSKLVFVRRSTNDSFLFYTDGWSSQIRKEQTQEDCYKNLEFGHRFLTFRSDETADKIILSVLYYAESNPFLEVSFNNNIYSTSLGSLTPPYSFDSLNIQNVWRYNIRAFKHSFDPGINNEYSCFYNTTDGIIKLEGPAGESWELRKSY